MSDGDDPGDETRASELGMTPRGMAILGPVVDEAAMLLFGKPRGALVQKLCPACGVAWGMDCGRTNCGLSETSNAGPTE